MRRKRPQDEAKENMTAMIDVVFQLLIFFVVTSNLQSQGMLLINLAEAPHGTEVAQKDPRTIEVDVDSKGRVMIASTRLSIGQLTAMLQKVAGEQGKKVPIVIRGDLDSRHEEIKDVMDAASAAGLTKIKFAAIREKAKKQ